MISPEQISKLILHSFGKVLTGLFFPQAVYLLTHLSPGKIRKCEDGKHSATARDGSRQGSEGLTVKRDEDKQTQQQV